MTGYQGGFPNIENLLKTLFTSVEVTGFLGDVFTGIEPTYWLPANETIETTVRSGGGYLRIFRTGGRVDFEQNRDEPIVQIAVLTQSRDKSWEVMEAVRTGVLWPFSEAVAIVPGTVHKLQCAGEIVGPQLIPEQFRDERLVLGTFAFHTWKPGGLPNYRQALGL